ncbi:hypothetical protein Bbelb_011650 [Branchiostoma belcheri]|nr:hypothetical protein Bbelb_011650 [Branchiostoma belcheri]
MEMKEKIQNFLPCAVTSYLPRSTTVVTTNTQLYTPLSLNTAMFLKPVPQEQVPSQIPAGQFSRIYRTLVTLRGGLNASTWPPEISGWFRRATRALKAAREMLTTARLNGYCRTTLVKSTGTDGTSFPKLFF